MAPPNRHKIISSLVIKPAMAARLLVDLQRRLQTLRLPPPAAVVPLFRVWRAWTDSWWPTLFVDSSKAELRSCSKEAPLHFIYSHKSSAFYKIMKKKDLDPDHDRQINSDLRSRSDPGSNLKMWSSESDHKLDHYLCTLMNQGPWQLSQPISCLFRYQAL